VYTPTLKKHQVVRDLKKFENHWFRVTRLLRHSVLIMMNITGKLNILTTFFPQNMFVVCKRRLQWRSVVRYSPSSATGQSV